MLADPVTGGIDRDPGLDQEAIHLERGWGASIDLPPANRDRADAHLAALLDTYAIAFSLQSSGLSRFRLLLDTEAASAGLSRMGAMLSRPLKSRHATDIYWS